MKRFLKVLGIVVLILLALLIILPFAFKGKIINTVKKAANENLNAKVEFADLGVSLIRHFPNISVSLDSLSIIGVNTFEGDTLVSIPDFMLTLNLMSVLKGDSYEVKTVEINDARIYLKVLENGQTNWDIAKEDTTEVIDTTAAAAFEVSLKKLNLKNSFLIYDDASIPVFVRAEGINHTLKGDLTETITDLDTKTVIDDLLINYDGVRYLSGAKATLDSKINADLDKFKFTFPDAHLILNDLELLAKGFFAMPGEDYDMDIEFNAVQNEFKHFLSLIPAVYAKDFDKIDASGALGFKGYVKGIYNDKKIPSFGLDLKIADARFKYPDLPGAVENINIEAIIDNKTGEPDATIVDVDKFHIEMMGNPVDAVIHARTPVSDPYIDATVKGKIDLADVSKVYPLEEGDKLSGLINADFAVKGNQSDAENQRFDEFYADGEMLINNLIYRTSALDQTINISEGKFDLSPANISMPVMNVKIGNNDIAAVGNITNYLAYAFDKGVLKGTMNLKSNYFNLNDFMAEDSTVTDTSSSGLSIVEIPKGIDFTMNSTFKEVLYDKLKLSNATGMLTIKDQVLALKDLKFNTMQGQMTLNGYYSTKVPDEPEVDMTMNISNIEIREAFENFITVQKLAPIAKQTQGKISSNLNINTKLGANMMPLPATMHGKGNLTSPALVINNVTAFNRVADALKLEEFKRWSIDKINLSFEIEAGKVFVKPFTTKLGKINAEISGWNSFDQTLEYAMDMQIPRSTFGGAANNALQGLVKQANSKGANFSLGETVPVTVLITGTVTDPKISTSLKSIGSNIKETIKESVKEKAEEVVGKAKEEAGKYIEEANQKAQKIIDDAQLKANQLIAAAQKSAQKIRNEADVQADKLVAEGKKKGMVAELAAKKAADKVRSEGDKKADGVIAEAQKQADAIMATARQQADKIKADAQNKTK
ncbi:MAG TPA: AsmA-like C-terminal region-containing protein [Lentimicrobium sp.]|nr:AsmA-like C-terminal region-containing protein [Lentimicrobium sp.]